MDSSNSISDTYGNNNGFAQDMVVGLEIMPSGDITFSLFDYELSINFQ